MALLLATTLLLSACASVVPETEAGVADPDEERTPGNGSSVDDPFGDVRLRFDPDYWPNTDFSRHSVEYREILSGGPPPDGIPAIDEPVFESIDDATQWLELDWPVMFFEHNGDARAYPLAILVYHEIVNDVVGDLPVTLTFCPLCNATIAFERDLGDGRILDFGTTGNLRNSDLIMYDRQTQSWWQQFTGEAIVGELTGTVLAFLPSQIISWGEFVTAHPEGLVLSRNTGHSRPYGRNPYAGYDTIGSNPFLYNGELDSRLPAVERVVALEVAGIFSAYPFSVLEETRVANDVVSQIPVVIFWKGGTASALSPSAFEVGSSAAYLRTVGDQILTFNAVGDHFEDSETGSQWNIFGEAVSGPLQGEGLTQIVSAEHFWFAWAAFRPDTIVWSP
jgi:hypothetical protein